HPGRGRPAAPNPDRPRRAARGSRALDPRRDRLAPSYIPAVGAVDLKGLLASPGDEHARWARTINPQFVRVLKTIGFDRTWARAEGAYLYDQDGNRFLDMLGGFGMYNVGRNNLRIRAALVEALELETP